MPPTPSYYTLGSEASADVFTDTDFEEMCETLEQPGGGDTLTKDDGECVLVGYIPYNKKRSAFTYLTGYDWADNSTPWALHRLPPVRCPIWPHMRCVGASFIGYNPEGNSAASLNKAQVPSPVPLEPIKKYTRYSRARTTLRFKPHPYPFATDTQLAGNREYYRNTSVFDSVAPVLELLMADTAQGGEDAGYVKFLEGTDHNGASLVGKSFPGVVAERLTKANLFMVWHDVPWEYVFNPYLPQKIMNCVGRVNSNVNWLTVFPKGTLLLEAPIVKKKQLNAWTTNDYIPFVADIVLPFVFVDPTPAAGTGSTIFRGWNLWPFSRLGEWWSAARNGDASKPVFEFVDFDTIFTHVSGP